MTVNTNFHGRTIQVGDDDILGIGDPAMSDIGGPGAYRAHFFVGAPPGGTPLDEVLTGGMTTTLSSDENGQTINVSGDGVLDITGNANDDTINLSGHVDLEVTGSGFEDVINVTGDDDTLHIVGDVSDDIVTVSGNDDTINLPGPATNSTLYELGEFASLTLGGTGWTVDITAPPCFRRGVRILTDAGEVAVEKLAVGDRVINKDGLARPIRWIGHRDLDCRFHPEPEMVWPIRVAKGAFAENQPSRDLWVSPKHSIYWEGVLTPVLGLVNGRTISRHACARVEYWHVELDSHDILVSDGLTTESYLDNGSRTSFENGGAFLQLHPNFEPSDRNDTCVPLLDDGPEVEWLREILLARAKILGCAITSDPDLHVIADGARIEPIRLGEWRFAFAIPADRADISLNSRWFIPAEIDPGGKDKRILGVCVGRLQVDGDEVPLEDEAAFADGWHGLEPDRRWSNGSALLPGKSRLVVVDLAGEGRYWVEEKGNVVALFA
jgi:hypothetical protein